MSSVLRYVLIAFAVSIILLPRPLVEGTKLERTSTIAARFSNYEQTFTIIKDNILFGVGFNTLRHAKKDYGFLREETWQESHAGAGSDSSFLFVWATTGVFGLFTYLFLWWKILTMQQSSDSEHRWNSETMRQKPLFIIFPVAVALLVHSFFLNSLFYPWIMLWFWLILGVSHAAANNRLVAR